MRANIERYLQGRLSAEEAAAFEEAYLADPELLDELMLTEKLQAGLSDGQSAVAGPGEAAARRSFWATPQYAAAASVLLAAAVVSSGTLFMQNRALREAGPSFAETSATRLVPLIAVRGQSERVLEAPAPGDLTVLLADPGFAQFDSYAAIVSRESAAGAEIVWQSSGLAPGYEGLLAIGVPGSELSPGRYRVAVQGRMNDWPASQAAEAAAQFSFEVGGSR